VAQILEQRFQFATSSSLPSREHMYSTPEPHFISDAVAERSRPLLSRIGIWEAGPHPFGNLPRFLEPDFRGACGNTLDIFC